MPAEPTINTLRIFVSSPGDVAEERALAARVLDRLRGELAGRATLEPIFWEHEPLLASEGFQSQILRPSEADIVVTILWSRLGTRLPADVVRPDGSRYESGTEFEFEDALRGYREAGRPELLVYRKTAEAVVSLKNRQAAMERLRDQEALDAFVERWFEDRADGSLVAAFHPFDSPGEFEELVETHLRELILRRLPEAEEATARRAATWRQGSPFRGLESFEPEYAPVFFGRGKAVADVLQALRRQAADGRPFVLVLGMSGGGKSSLVKAGVLPLLVQPGVIEGVGLWRTAIMTPSESTGDLFEGLAKALSRPTALPDLASGTTGAEELAAVLRDSPGSAVPWIKSALAAAASPSDDDAVEARLVLVVDQMEEIFTLEHVDGAEREAFFRALDALARSGRVWIVATLRSDFFPRCAELEVLEDLKQGAGQYDLAPPRAAEIAQMIRRPAAAAGLRFEHDATTDEGLDDLLRDAAVGAQASLPLLQFALEELYKRRGDGGVLTFDAYRELGGVEGALAQRAEEVFSALQPSAQATLPRVFRSLVRVDTDGGVATSKRVGIDSMGTTSTSEVPETPVEVVPEMATYIRFDRGKSGHELVDAFVEARLFVTELADDGRPVVKVAHEALLRHWPRLVAWLERDREDLRKRARLTAATARWEEASRSPDLLARSGQPLTEATGVLESFGAQLSEGERAFVEASKRRERRRKTLKRSVVTALVVLATGLAVLVGVLRAQSKRIAAEAERANLEAQTAERTVDFLTDLFSVSDPGEARGNTITAREILDRGAKEIAEGLTDQPLVRARLMNTMGDVYRKLGLFAEATSLVDEAVATHESTPGVDRLDLAASLESLASLHWEQGGYEKAEEFYGRALAIREESQGARHAALGPVLNNLANVQADQARYDEAAQLLERALAVNTEALGPEHPNVASNLHNLASIHWDRGDLGEAERLYQRALAVREKVLGSDHPSVANSAGDLGTVYHRQGRLEEAEALYRRSLEIKEKVFGLTHTTIAFTVQNLARLCDQQERYAEAEPMHRRALAIMRAADHPRQAQVLNSLGQHYRRRGRYADAEPLFESALAIQEETLGLDHPHVANTLLGYADLSSDRERYSEAKAMYRRAVAIYQQAYGPESPRLVRPMIDLAEILRAEGRNEEAAALEARADAISSGE